MSELVHQRYRLVKLLGTGGAGEVYRAFDVKLKREVALKRVHESRRTHSEALARLVREAEHLAQVEHPNVVVVHDILEAEGSVLIVMELVKGTPLVEHFRRRPIPEVEYLGYLRQVLAAVEAVHEVGIIHRDINSRNVLVSREGVVKLTDFGLSALASDAEHRFGGTLAYMAPEILRKGGRVTFGADIYSLGFLSYQALIGLAAFKKLYGAVRPRDWVRWVLSRQPFHTLAGLGAGVAPGLSALVARMLEKDAAARYQKIAQVRKDLEAFLADAYPALLGLPARSEGGEAPGASGRFLGALRKVAALRRPAESAAQPPSDGSTPESG